MDLDKQKNFYDNRRYFQGKDNPDDAHPAPKTGGVPFGHIVFGLLFIGFVAALFALRIHTDNAPPASQLLAAPGAQPAPAQAAAKK